MFSLTRPSLTSSISDLSSGRNPKRGHPAWQSWLEFPLESKQSPSQVTGFDISVRLSCVLVAGKHVNMFVCRWRWETNAFKRTTDISNTPLRFSLHVCPVILGQLLNRAPTVCKGYFNHTCPVNVSRPVCINITLICGWLTETCHWKCSSGLH